MGYSMIRYIINIILSKIFIAIQLLLLLITIVISNPWFLLTKVMEIMVIKEFFLEFTPTLQYAIKDGGKENIKNKDGETVPHYYKSIIFYNKIYNINLNKIKNSTIKIILPKKDYIFYENDTLISLGKNENYLFDNEKIKIEFPSSKEKNNIETDEEKIISIKINDLNNSDSLSNEYSYLKLDIYYNAEDINGNWKIDAHTTDDIIVSENLKWPTNYLGIFEEGDSTAFFSYWLLYITLYIFIKIIEKTPISTPTCIRNTYQIIVIFLFIALAFISATYILSKFQPFG